jgi:uncharacterized protein
VIRRNLTEALLNALGERPVVLLQGARGTGKSTLVASLAAHEHHARHLTFADPEILVAARADPAAFLETLGGPVVLDEVHRAPELLSPLRAAVERDPRPGRMLMIASSSVSAEIGQARKRSRPARGSGAPDSLAARLTDMLGERAEVLTLWPFSQGEIEGAHEGFVDALFSERLPSLARAEDPWHRVVERITRGGYPDVVAHETEVRRRAWFGAYIAALVQPDTASIEGAAALPRLLGLLASRGAARLSIAEMARGIGVPMPAVRRHLALLEAGFLVHGIAPWRAQGGRRTVGAPRRYVGDTGLVTYLLVTTPDRLAAEPTVARPTLGVFVLTELRKQLAWSATRAELSYFRNPSGVEVDVVLEEPRGRLVGIAITTSPTVSPRDFTGLRVLAEITGPRFQRGVLLYGGAETVPFGPKLHALPVSALWRLGATPHQAPA